MKKYIIILLSILIFIVSCSNSHCKEQYTIGTSIEGCRWNSHVYVTRIVYTDTNCNQTVLWQRIATVYDTNIINEHFKEATKYLEMLRNNERK